MASDGAPEKKQTGKGFAGLDSLLSKVDETVGAGAANRSARSADTAAPPKTTRPARQRAAGGERDPPAESRPVQPPPAPRSSRSPGGKRLLKWGGIAFVVYVLWHGASSNNPSPRSDYSPPPATTGIELPAPRADVDPFVTGALAEEKPPVGTGRVLTMAQIRYCVSEDIRLEAASKSVNRYWDSHVDRFNAMANDYNSRCGRFQYKGSSLETAKREAERIRFLLEVEVRRRFGG